MKNRVAIHLFKKSSGPEVRGVRPVLVTFETFKDRDTVLRQARTIKKGANIGKFILNDTQKV